jgi:hypothetical protein
MSWRWMCSSTRWRPSAKSGRFFLWWPLSGELLAVVVQLDGIIDPSSFAQECGHQAAGGGRRE